MAQDRVNTPDRQAPARGFSVLVSSYNYGPYVGEAVASALDQTLPPIEVIVVDDGSTDDSVARLRTRFGGDARVRIVEQANAGQLSAWITGFALSRGEFIALLDSDDLWEPDHLAAMARVFQNDPSVDFVYCNMALFGARDGLLLNRRWHRRDRDLGTSVLLGCFHPRWQGAATSGNVLRRALMAEILTLPGDQVPLWRTRPDDCLFYGSDILGAHKVYLAEPLARHREHAANALLADAKSPLRRMRYELRRERMLAHYRSRIDASPRLLCLAKTEFRTKPCPMPSEWWLYLLMAAASPQRLHKRIGQMFSITGHFLRSRLRAGRSA